MKNPILWLVVLAVVAFGGFWVGRITQKPVFEYDYGKIFTCGYGDFRKETFEQINSEMNHEIDTILGWAASMNRDQAHLVVVAPDGFGYRVRMAGRGDSELWTANNLARLEEWIDKRIGEIEAEKRLAEQAVAPNRSLPPSRKSTPSVRGPED